jgi:hypothetical protein
LKPVPIDQLFANDSVLIKEVARKIHDEVGRPDSEKIQYDEKAVHIIRRLTIEEERKAKRFSRSP